MVFPSDVLVLLLTSSRLTEIPSSESLQIASENAANAYMNYDLSSDVDISELESLKVSTPAIYSGLIASGDQFISSQEKLQELKQRMDE